MPQVPEAPEVPSRQVTREAAGEAAMRTAASGSWSGPAGLSSDDDLEIRHEPPGGVDTPGGVDAPGELAIAGDLDAPRRDDEGARGWSRRLGETAGGDVRRGVASPVAIALRDSLVAAFNERDLDGLLALCDPAVECPDLHGDGVVVLADELTVLWERSPGLVLTEGSLEGEPCAVAWLPTGEGAWTPAAMVRIDVVGERLGLVGMLEDVGYLAAVESWAPEDVEADESAEE